MKRLLLAVLILFASVSLLNAQGIQQCYTTNGANCIPVSPDNPLPTTVLNAADIHIGAITGTGTAGTAAVNPVTVQGIASMTPLSVGGQVASGAALSGNPVRIGISDGTNSQNLLAAIALGDGVNGNNTAAVGPFVWNGTTWDRMPGNTVGLTVKIAGSSSNNVTTNTDTNVKASAGTFVGISVNTGGTTSNVKIYDDADGTCNSGLIGTFSTLTAGTYFSVNAAMATGICAKTAGGAAADITILYR